ncbi:hypothetical protein MNBD_GAMMA06-1829, partial [hydrothermal vent metagenome]
MKKQLKTIPQFANEKEEQLFWEKNYSSDYLDWNKANKVVMPNLKPTTKTISLRLPQHLLDSIKSAAHARDVPYQSLIKVWLQEKL